MCKKCNTSFIPKSGNVVSRKQEISISGKREKVKRSSPVINWEEELSPGDIVKIKQGSGPFYILGNGEREYLSINGIVMVKQKESNGFWATHCKLKHKRGTFFVYMGKTCRSPADNSLIRKRHKLLKLTVKEKNVGQN